MASNETNIVNAVAARLEANNMAKLRELIVLISDEADKLIEDGTDPKNINVEMWIVPIPGKPPDGELNNYHTVTFDYFSLDIQKLLGKIKTATAPARKNRAIEQMYLKFLQDGGELKIFFRCIEKKGITTTLPCNIIIPQNQVTE